jgi:hypothetical protein
MLCVEHVSSCHCFCAGQLVDLKAFGPAFSLLANTERELRDPCVALSKTFEGVSSLHESLVCCES